MWFCPLDGTLLQVMPQPDGRNCFVCATCPYSCEITSRVTKKTYLERKKVDSVLGGEDAWKGYRTQAHCSKCGHDQAYFMQIQIRSADEPMSIFYKCCKCSHQWNDK